jgi:hypothetical protein
VVTQLHRTVGFSTGLVLVALVVLAGCGGAPTAGPEAAATTGPTAAASLSPGGGGSPTLSTSRPADDDGPSYGVDHVSWPATIAGARQVLNAVPKTVAGHKHKTYTDPRDKDTAELDYGTFGMVIISSERGTGTKKSLASANNALSATFGLGLACAKGTFRGTAPPPSYPGGGPSVTEKPLTKPVWFSCTVDGAEGDDNFTGAAVGWTSRHTAWLVVAHDPAAAQLLVAALRDAVQ